MNVCLTVRAGQAPPLQLNELMRGGELGGSVSD